MLAGLKLKYNGIGTGQRAIQRGARLRASAVLLWPEVTGHQCSGL
jgi:hypothetical protein